MKKLTPKQRLFVTPAMKLAALYELGRMQGMWGTPLADKSPKASADVISGLFRAYLNAQSEYSRTAIAMLMDYFYPAWRADVHPALLGPIVPRDSREVLAWRDAVLERDRVCQKCGIGQHLEVHHIVPWAVAPWLRILIENGQALCEECHLKETVRYGH